MSVDDFDRFKKRKMGVWSRVLMNETIKARATVCQFRPGAVERLTPQGETLRSARGIGFDPAASRISVPTPRKVGGRRFERGETVRGLRVTEYAPGRVGLVSRVVTISTAERGGAMLKGKKA